MLSGPLPLFPLPRCVLLPGVRVGLHLFEARYRSMAEDLGAQGTGFILVRARVESDSDLLPPEAATFDIGTRVDILQSARQPDGRFNLLVEGVEAVQIEEIPSSRPYRLARWRSLALPGETWPEPEREALLQALRIYLMSLKLPFEVIDNESSMPIELSDVPQLATALDLPLPERQFLLEAPGLREMARRLGELLTFAASGRGLRGS